MADKISLENYYALLIGVGGKDMEATIEDATALGSVLGDPKLAGYPKKNVYLLTTKKATKENVIKHLDLIAKKTKDVEDSTVFIYYSGHGGRFPVNAKKNEFNYYLLTHGCDFESDQAHMLSGTIFAEKIDAIKATKMIVLLDCCHAAGMQRNKSALQKKGLASAKPAPKVEISGETLVRQLKTGEGRVYISSCKDDEESVIINGDKNSLFTLVALEALKGAISRTAFVKVIDLMFMLLNEVPERVAKYDHAQNPVISKAENLTGAYHLCLNGKKALIKKGRALAGASSGLTDADKIKAINNYSFQVNIGGGVGTYVTVTNVKRDLNIN